MIEVVSAARCIRCDICVRVCPADVFVKDAKGLPFIARQDDCQTCFLCEIYCPTDALYVAEAAGVDAEQVACLDLMLSDADRAISSLGYVERVSRDVDLAQEE